MRIIFYTGNGGTGKSSMAALSSLKLAELGLRTLIMSKDNNHSLTNIFDMPIGNEPTKITNKLWGVEIDHILSYKYWDIILDWLRRVMKWEKLKRISLDEIPIIPGIKEIISLFEINKYIRDNQYDVIIIDSELMGEVLRLLSYPELIEYWGNRLFRKDRYLFKMVRPFANMVTNFELPSDDVIQSGDYLLKQLLALQKVVLNQEITSFRIVMNPNNEDLLETRKLVTYMNMFGFNIDSIIINKIFTNEVEKGFYSNWFEEQFRSIKEIEESFYPLPIQKIFMHNEKIEGINVLRTFSAEIFNQIDLSQVLYKDKFVNILKEEDHYTLVITMPNILRTHPHLKIDGDVLIIETESNNRKIYLPRILSERTVEGMKINKDKLLIRFIKKPL